MVHNVQFSGTRCHLIAIYMADMLWNFETCLESVLVAVSPHCFLDQLFWPKIQSR